MNRLPLFVLVAAALAGCGPQASQRSATESAKIATDTVAADKQFIAQVNALPTDQRQAFLANHFQQYRRLMNDPDPSVKAAFLQFSKRQ